jgi:D-alanyl-D-alanine carboxypeptidase
VGEIVRQLRVFFVALTLIFACGPAVAAKYASIIVDTATGAVLHAQNPDERAYPASLTKMMTLYMVFEALKAKRVTMETPLPVSLNASRKPPSKLGLKKGQTILLRDAIRALITKSANDVATVVAEALGGSEPRFAHMMTTRARALGMGRTTFRNASGLPNKGQMSTVRDMARLGIALQRDFPQYYGLFATKEFEYKGRRFRNHNRLLTRYDGTDGIKTGYIRDSGFNIVVSVERKGRRLIGAVFGGKSAGRRDRHMAQLLSGAFKAIFDGDNPPVEPLPALIADKDDDPSGTTDEHEDERGEAIAAARPPRAATAGVAVAAVPAPPAAPEGSAENPTVEQWAVQVGAFNRYAPAHLAATRAARQVPALMNLQIVIVPGKSRSRPLYRARLVGLDEEKARAACRALLKRDFKCLPIKHETTRVITR